MSDYDYYGYYSKPIKTDRGIKASSKRGDFVKNWWATRWIKALEILMDPGRLTRGRRYARQGQVLSLEESKGVIKASVQGSRKRAYEVTVKVAKLSQKQWEQAVDVLANQALFTAQLLAGEMPPDIEEAFEAAGASLFPDSEQALEAHCSCPDPGHPCKHIAAVHYLLGERFDQDPFLLFRLRGRSQEQILAALQDRRPVETGSPAEGDDREAEAVAPLADSLDDFWQGQPLTALNTAIKPPAAETPVLKRLGQPPFLDQDIIELLGPAYRAISEQALVTAFEEEAPDEKDNSE